MEQLGFILNQDYTTKLIDIANHTDENPEVIIYKAIDTMWKHYKDKDSINVK